MKCPVDETVLVMSERQGVEIDYCPQCRGIWLDRGELDKLLDRAEAEDRRDDDDDDDRRPERRDEPRRDEPRRDEPRRDDRHDAPHYGGYGHKKKKRKSFLSEFLEFGD